MPASALYSIALLCEKVPPASGLHTYYVPDGKRTVITQIQITDDSTISGLYVLEDLFTTTILLRTSYLGPSPNTQTFEGRIVIPDDGGFGNNGFTFKNSGDGNIWLYVGGYELFLP